MSHAPHVSVRVQRAAVLPRRPNYVHTIGRLGRVRRRGHPPRAHQQHGMVWASVGLGLVVVGLLVWGGPALDTFLGRAMCDDVWNNRLLIDLHDCYRRQGVPVPVDQDISTRSASPQGQGFLAPRDGQAFTNNVLMIPGTPTAGQVPEWSSWSSSTSAPSAHFVGVPFPCTVGAIYVDTKAKPTPQLYACTAADTWTRIHEGGTGEASRK